MLDKVEKILLGPMDSFPPKLRSQLNIKCKSRGYRALKINNKRVHKSLIFHNISVYIFTYALVIMLVHPQQFHENAIQGMHKGPQAPQFLQYSQDLAAK